MSDSVTHIATLASLAERPGQHLAVSPWVTVSQERINPVSSGSRLRAQIGLKAYEPIADGAQLTMTMTVTIERDGSDKPACVAETVSRCFT